MDDLRARLLQQRPHFFTGRPVVNKVDGGFCPGQQAALFVVIDIADEVVGILRRKVLLMLHGEIDHLHTGLFQHLTFLKIDRLSASFDKEELIHQ